MSGQFSAGQLASFPISDTAKGEDRRVLLLMFGASASAGATASTLLGLDSATITRCAQWGWIAVNLSGAWQLTAAGALETAT